MTETQGHQCAAFLTKREHIATAIAAAMYAHPTGRVAPTDDLSVDAVRAADNLIRALNREDLTSPATP